MNNLYRDSPLSETYKPFNGIFPQMDKEASFSLVPRNNCSNNKNRSKSFDIFLSVLSQVVLSDDEEEEDEDDNESEDWSVISGESAVDARNCFFGAGGVGGVRKVGGQEGSLQEVHDQNRVMTQLNEVQVGSSEHLQAKCVQKGVPREKSQSQLSNTKIVVNSCITVDDTHNDHEESMNFEDNEIPEDPLPHFLEKVDALSQLNVSSSTLELTRTRVKRKLGRSNFLSRYNSTSEIELETSISSPRRQRQGSVRSVLSTNSAFILPPHHRTTGSFSSRGGDSCSDLPPSLPSREKGLPYPGNPVRSQHYRRLSECFIFDTTTTGSAKGMDLSPRMPRRNNVQQRSSFNLPEDSSDDENSNSSEEQLSFSDSSSDCSHDVDDDDSTICIE